MRVWQVVSGTLGRTGWLGEVLFDDVGALLASTLAGFQVGRSSGPERRAFRASRVERRAPDDCGGREVKLCCRIADGWRSALAFRRSADGATDASAEIQAALPLVAKSHSAADRFCLGSAVTVDGVGDLVVDASGA